MKSSDFMSASKLWGSHKARRKRTALGLHIQHDQPSPNTKEEYVCTDRCDYLKALSFDEDVGMTHLIGDSVNKCFDLSLYTLSY